MTTNDPLLPDGSIVDTMVLMEMIKLVLHSFIWQVLVPQSLCLW